MKKYLFFFALIILIYSCAENKIEDNKHSDSQINKELEDSIKYFQNLISKRYKKDYP